jgi:lipopolysaccharide export system ATP-binding protein
LSKLYAKNLVKVYGGRRVVNDVSVEVSQSEIVGLLGPNGAGKTTTFNMIIGFVRPNGGKVLLDTTEITELPMYQRARMGIGYLTQEVSIFRRLTVEENILAIIEMLDLPRDQQAKKLEQMLDELGIAHLAKSPAYTLSGGERRRVEIARALVTSPSFILLDEPFTGIDPIAIEELQAVIYSMRARGLGILITDHNVRETLQVTDHSYIIYDGKIELAGTAQEIVNDPRAREVYLGERFYMDMRPDHRKQETKPS